MDSNATTTVTTETTTTTCKRPQATTTSNLHLKMFILSIMWLLAATHQLTTTQAFYLAPSQLDLLQAPTITPFAFNLNVQEGQRASVLCTISSGDLTLASISWLKDGQLLTPSIAQVRKITIKPDSDQSTLKFNSVRLDHAGNYTCVAKNRFGIQAHSSQLIVHGEPRWLSEPQHEPIVATRGQTIVIDCQTTGWPKPQQSWLIKTFSQSEFEPLAVTATGRISLAQNGSLIIRNADKSDEANYLCKSANGIGKGISWSTSLKVNVPAHFEQATNKPSFVRKQQSVQMRCDAYGDEPITIEWFKNKQRLTNDLDGRYSLHNKQLANGLISQLQIKQSQRSDNSIYECFTRNLVGKDKISMELLVLEEPDNIQEIQVSAINSRSATLSWTEPYDGRSPITSYTFQYKKIASELSQQVAELDGFVDGSLEQQSLMASKQVFQEGTSADDWQQAPRINLPAHSTGMSNSSGLIRSITIDKLEPSTRYVLRALAINSIGQSKFSQPMEFITEEEPPEMGPVNIRAVAINSTSIQVSWDEMPKSRQVGRIQGYFIGYRAFSNSSTGPMQNFVQKPYVISDQVIVSPHLHHLHQHHHHHHNQQQQQQQQQVDSSSSSPGQVQRLETILTDLRRDTTYEITVVAFNGRGSGPSSEFVVCKTIEMEAPKAVKLQIRRESNESIFIEWQRDPLDQNPIDDYVLYQEKNSASAEWLQLRLPANQTQYKAPGLKCGTRYQFYIIAQNKVGKSAPSEVVSASTSGALPVIPSKTSLIKLINSTCLLVNLNSFQDNGCRIKTFTVRYRVERSGAPNGSAATTTNSHLIASNGLVATHQALQSSSSPSKVLTSSGATMSTSNVGSSNSAVSAAGLPGLPVNSQVTGGPAMQATVGAGAASLAAASSASPATVTSPGEWITIRPKSNAKHQRAIMEEDRMEYLCDLSPVGEYTVHVAAATAVGSSEIEYSVNMASDELRQSIFKELVELIACLPNLLAYIPSMLVFLLAGLLLSLVSLILYTTVIKYYQKGVIMHNQLRAARRAKRDEKRRRKLNNSRHSQKLDLWADDYDEDDDEGIEGDEEEDELEVDDEEQVDGDDEREDESAGSSSGNSNNRLHRQQHRAARFLNASQNGHYLSNIANSAFDSSSIDSRCNNNNNKLHNGSACRLSTASTDSMHNRFQCLNSKQYVKMNEYTMLPTISASLSPSKQQRQSPAQQAAVDIYGTARGPTLTGGSGSGSSQSSSSTNNNNNPFYYSTLRRSNMQTYLPARSQQQSHLGTRQQQQQQQHQHRRSSGQQQNIGDIYGYYMSPLANQANQAVPSHQQVAAAAQQAANEAANSIFVPPQQIIYSAPNIRRQPAVFL